MLRTAIYCERGSALGSTVVLGIKTRTRQRMNAYATTRNTLYVAMFCVKLEGWEATGRRFDAAID